MVEIIGEIGTNHNGDLETAYKLIDMAIESNIDTVKFQIYDADDIVSPLVKSSLYGYNNTKYLYWGDYINNKLITPKEWLKELVPYAKKRGLQTLATAHSIEGANYCLEHGIESLKIASMDCNYYTFLEELSKLNTPLLLSTGMAMKEEIIKSSDILLQNQEDVTLFHCTSTYPTQYNEVNLEFFKFLKTLSEKIGLSDHSEKNDIAMMSLVYGVCKIEKHITLDKTTDGPDHPFALDKTGLVDLVQCVRNGELALGFEDKIMSKKELENRKKYRRVAIAKRDLQKGDSLQKSDFIFARPSEVFDDMIDSHQMIEFENKILKQNIQAGKSLLVSSFL